MNSSKIRGKYSTDKEAREDLGDPRSQPPWFERNCTLPFGALTPDEFEIFCYLLLLEEDLSTEIFYYGKTGDLGRDIVRLHADGLTELIQCKRYGNNVGIGDVRLELAKLYTNVYTGAIPPEFDSKTADSQVSARVNRLDSITYA